MIDKANKNIEELEARARIKPVPIVRLLFSSQGLFFAAVDYLSSNYNQRKVRKESIAVYEKSAEDAVS